MTIRSLTRLGLWLWCIAFGCRGQLPHPPSGLLDDKDFDGYFGTGDLCSDLAEDGLPPAPRDGCPNRDPDGDKIIGATDACPWRAENLNHFEDADGCPDEPIIDDSRGRRVNLVEPLSFIISDTAVLGPAAERQLEDVAGFLERGAVSGPVLVVVYERRGRGVWLSLALSSARAEAIRRTLSRHGVTRSEIGILGLGDYCAESLTARPPTLQGLTLCS